MHLVLPVHASDLKQDSPRVSDQPVMYFKVFPQQPLRQLFARAVSYQLTSYGLQYTLAQLSPSDYRLSLSSISE